MQKRIFIGSSGERIGVLEKVAQLLEPVGVIQKWMSAFKPNKSNLDSLLLQTRLADYSVLIAGQDDKVRTKGITKDAARDNMIFEFGLFLGASGLRKSFMLVEEGVVLPTDLDGITLFRYTETAGQYNSLDKICSMIANEIVSDTSIGELNLLPSTALAIGYFNSFLKPACEELHDQQCVYNGSTKITFDEFVMRVVVPQQLDADGVQGINKFYTRKRGLTKVIALNRKQEKRDYPFHVKIEQPSRHMVTCDIHDVPSTLNTIQACIGLYLPSDNVGGSAEQERLEKRELDNFCKVVACLVKKDTVARNHVVIERI